MTNQPNLFHPAGYAPVLLTAMVSAAWAETTTTTLQEVVVSAPRPAADTLNAIGIGAARIDTLAPSTSDTASLLRDLPGVALQSGGGVSSLPIIRGLGDDRLRIKVDGMDLIAACPNHMNPALSYIDPSAVESIKVFAGATPVSIGGDSIGGSIVVKSAKMKFAQPGAGLLTTGEVGGYYRSNGDAWGANAKLTLASEILSLTYTGSSARSANYKAGGDFKPADYNGTVANDPYLTGRPGHLLALDEVGSTAYKSTNQSLGLAWRNDNHLFDLVLSHQDIPYEGFPNQRMDMTGNTSDKINLGYEGLLGWGVLKARAYHEKTDHEMDFGDDKRWWYGSAAGGGVDGSDCGAMSTTCAWGMPMYTESRNTGLNVNGEIALSGRDILRVGGEYQAYRLDDWWPPSGAGMWPNTFWNINNGQRDRYALFGEWEANINPRLTSLFGLRHETVKMNADPVQGYNSATDGMGTMMHYQKRDSDAFNVADRSKTDRNWDLSALARFTSGDTETYEIGLAQKTRSPSLYERYTWSTWQMAAAMNNFVGDGNGYVGDIDLKPEVAHTLNLVADWHAADKKAWGMRVAPYYSRVKDYIDAKRLSLAASGYGTLQYVNQNARLYGIDFSAFVRLASGTAYGDFSLSGLINWVDGQNRDTGDNLYNIMPLNGKLALTRQWGNWSNTLEGVFVAGKRDTSAVRSELETRGYSLFNLRASYRWKQARLDFGVENLFDINYDLPLGGVYVGQGKTMSLSGGPMWGTAVPGPGRSLYVGLNYRF